MDIKTLSFSDQALTVQPLCGALVARNAAAFASTMLPLMRPGMQLEINLSSVRHMDGAGLGAVLTCRHAMRRLGCSVVLTQVQAHLVQELNACGLQSLLAPAGAESTRGLNAHRFLQYSPESTS